MFCSITNGLTATFEFNLPDDITEARHPISIKLEDLVDLIDSKNSYLTRAKIREVLFHLSEQLTEANQELIIETPDGNFLLSVAEKFIGMEETLFVIRPMETEGLDEGQIPDFH